MSTGWQSPDLFGRDYNLEVTLASGGSLAISSADLEPGALRFRFEVNMYVQQVLWWAEISIYNLDYKTAKSIIQQGDNVLLQAGYKNGIHQMATIFEGRVFQPLWHRENVVDFVLTLQCFAGNAQNFINTNYGQLVTHRDLVDLICQNAYSEITIANVDDDVLTKTKLPRGGVLFGDPAKLLSDIGRQNGLVTWIGPEGLNMVDLASLLSGQQLTATHAAYAPPIPPGSKAKAKPSLDYSIIGTPKQTWEGLDFTVLLDPSLKVKYPPDVVKLDMSSTQIDLLPLPQPFGSGGQGFIPPPDATGFTFIVAGLRHVGDTRGNPWYTEICGVTQNGLALALGGNY